MFENLTYGHLMVVALAALFILGPERLPEAASWLARAIGDLRRFSTGVRNQLHQDLGPDLEEFRKPFEELRQPLSELRHYDPRHALTRTFFNNDQADPPHSPLPRPDPSPLHQPWERPPIDPDAT